MIFFYKFIRFNFDFLLLTKQTCIHFWDNNIYFKIPDFMEHDLLSKNLFKLLTSLNQVRFHLDLHLPPTYLNLGFDMSCVIKGPINTGDKKSNLWHPERSLKRMVSFSWMFCWAVCGESYSFHSGFKSKVIITTTRSKGEPAVTPKLVSILINAFATIPGGWEWAGWEWMVWCGCE